MMTLVPLHGTYMVVRIDPAAMIEPFNDPALPSAARRIHTRKYLAYVFEIHHLPLASRPWHECRILLVSRGRLNPAPGECMHPDMCVPIYPATDHPTREALHPLPHFPFDDCYHYSHMDAIVRIPTRQYDESSAVVLPEDDIIRHEKYLRDDYRHFKALRSAQDRDHSSSAASMRDSASITSSETSSSSVSTEDMRVIAPVKAPRKDEAIVPLVSVSFDLADVEDIADPHCFAEEEAAVARLIKLARAGPQGRARLQELARDDAGPSRGRQPSGRRPADGAPNALFIDDWGKETAPEASREAPKHGTSLGRTLARLFTGVLCLGARPDR